MHSRLFKQAFLLICLPFFLAAQQKNSTLKTITITVDAEKKAQVIENFGVAGCWGMPEAVTLTYLYEGGRKNNMKTANQIHEF